jgi:hypothetical protein
MEACVDADDEKGKSEGEQRNEPTTVRSSYGTTMSRWIGHAKQNFGSSLPAQRWRI